MSHKLIILKSATTLPLKRRFHVVSTWNTRGVFARKKSHETHLGQGIQEWTK